jgi:hypothetical protein
MRVSHSGRIDRNRRRGASGGKIQYGLNLLTGHVVVLHNFLDAWSYSRFSKITEIGIRVLRRTHAPLTLPGMLSTAGH